MKLLVVTFLVLLQLTSVSSYKMHPRDLKLAKIAVSKKTKVDLKETFTALRLSLKTHKTNQPLSWITDADEDSPSNVSKTRSEYLQIYHAELDRIKGNNVPRGMFGNQPKSKMVLDETRTVGEASSVKHSLNRKKWGVEDQRDYWFDPRIHTFGNTGFTGGLHAVCAPVATKIIDNVAYEGRSVREEIAEELKVAVGGGDKHVLDMCCGVGISTRALAKSFDEADSVVVGLDTSPEMLAMAKMQTTYSSLRTSFAAALESLPETTRNMLSFVRGNAEKTLFKKGTFDLVTIMYAFHEAPKMGRYRYDGSPNERV
ncbi:hypothetical protein TL16_g01210 [Triparma laevis f. inornata]|uniref:Methyltransferase type 11 domain-containing protein n=1 Tax=Triparma laevis f. inornata TaxID=1714386 RepID=A0A9W6ZKT0_9STRA|nr:hypothetical protein TL16_g01210 [Triparma laevis f. inornata]